MTMVIADTETIGGAARIADTADVMVTTVMAITAVKPKS